MDAYDDVRAALHALLSSEGFEVKSTGSVVAALAVASEWPPEIILFDLGVRPSIVDAHDLRAGLAPHGLFIIMTTLDVPTAGEWLEVEDFHVRKPFDVSQLVAVVDAWFSERR